MALVFGAPKLLAQDIVGMWHGVNCSGIEVMDDKTMSIANHQQDFKYKIRKNQLIINSAREDSYYGYIEDYRYEIKLLTADSLIIVPHTSEYNLFINERDSRLFFVKIKE